MCRMKNYHTCNLNLEGKKEREWGKSKYFRNYGQELFKTERRVKT